MTEAQFDNIAMIITINAQVGQDGHEMTLGAGTVELPIKSGGAITDNDGKPIATKLQIDTDAIGNLVANSLEGAVDALRATPSSFWDKVVHHQDGV